MLIRLGAVLAVFLMAAFAMAAAQNAPKPLSGDYYISGKTPIDPPSTEPDRTHFRIHLVDDSAKALWDLMPTDPVKWDCEPTSIFKINDGITCEQSADGNYECWFAVNVSESTVEQSVGC